MALDVFFVSDIRQGLVSAVALTIETAQAHGPCNVDFVSGVPLDKDFVFAYCRGEVLKRGLFCVKM